MKSIIKQEQHQRAMIEFSWLKLKAIGYLCILLKIKTENKNATNNKQNEKNLWVVCKEKPKQCNAK